MKSADHTISTAQSSTKQNFETSRMNTAEPFSAAGALTVQSEQPAPVIEVEREDLTTFFAVGMVVNIVMITAYFIWAYKQWGKTGEREE